MVQKSVILIGGTVGAVIFRGENALEEGGGSTSGFRLQVFT